YEVGGELIESFSKISSTGFYYIKDGRYYLNLREIIKNKFIKYGINSFEDLFYCSFCKSYLYSFRRDNGITGRMLSILGKRYD
ncbi:MAG: laccase domain-containing protein, partial [Deferribacterales bacterium]